jgi:hypothetical protein
VTDDVLRSLALSSQVLGADTVVVLVHTKRGLAGVPDGELRRLTGADLGFFPIDDHTAALGEDIELLSSTSVLSPLRFIAGFVYDVESAKIDDLVHWGARSDPRGQCATDDRPTPPLPRNAREMGRAARAGASWIMNSAPPRARSHVRSRSVPELFRGRSAASY